MRTHAGLHAKARSEEWKRNARFEHELQYEVEFLERVKEAIGVRIAQRQRLVDEQIEKRRAERER